MTTLRANIRAIDFFGERPSFREPQGQQDMAREGNPVPFTVDGVNRYNSVAGVYWICQGPNAKGQYPVIYTGQAADVNNRIGQHFNDKTDCVWGYSPTTVFAIRIDKKADRDAREQAEIDLYKTPCNKQKNVS